MFCIRLLMRHRSELWRLDPDLQWVLMKTEKDLLNDEVQSERCRGNLIVLGEGN
jgi:hypothetical protein